MTAHKFYVSGTHCAACKIFIEDTLNQLPGVNNVCVNLNNKTLTLDSSSDKEGSNLAGFLSDRIKQNGYSISVEKELSYANSQQDLWSAIPVGIGVLLLFSLLQRSNLLNFGISGHITPITSLIIGLIASVSSCLAVVGGLVLSLSAKISQDKISDTKTFTLFHVGRLASFAVLGGILGAIGGAVGINLILSTTLGILASVIMILLGLNLFGVFTKHSITLPSRLFNFLKKIEHKTFTPLIIGFATFFLPCGFTQSMQVQALSSGSFMSGLTIMFAFALGTLPMLLFLSFGTASFAHGKYAPLFFKSAGVVIIGLGLFSLLSGLAALGVIDPLFNI
jgi:sulfite exporter TauE/SafE/copper chaperone CopZ